MAEPYRAIRWCGTTRRFRLLGSINVFAGSFRALRHRQFAAVWAASMLSAFGTWTQVAAVGIFTAEATGKVAWVGVVLTTSWLSMGLVSPWAGTLADRYDRRGLVATAQLGQAGLTLALAAAFALDFRSPFVLAVVAAVDGVLAAISRPAFIALTADLVPADELMEANSLAARLLERSAGFKPDACRGRIGSGVLRSCFRFQCGVLLGRGGGRGVCAKQCSAGSQGWETWAQLRAGVAAVRADARIQQPIKVGLAEMTLAAPIVALVPAMGQLTLHGSAADTGALFTALAVGGTAGAFVLTPLLKSTRPARGLYLMLARAGGLGLLRREPEHLACLRGPVWPGAVYTNIYAGAVAQLQRDAPAEYRGRVIALFYAVTSVGYALSTTALASLADLVGVRSVILGSCIALLVIAQLLHTQDEAADSRNADSAQDANPTASPKD